MSKLLAEVLDGDTLGSQGEIDKAVFNLWLFENSDQDFFTIKLYRLLQSADRMNRYKLCMGFPIECAVFTAWENSPTSEDFYARAGFTPPGKMNDDRKV